MIYHIQHFMQYCHEQLPAFEKHPVYSRTEKVRIDVLKRFGYFSTESNKHLSEYLPWYRKRPEETPEWISLYTWINGETASSTTASFLTFRRMRW